MSVAPPLSLSPSCVLTGVGKTSLVQLLCHGDILSSPAWTVGCSVDVKVRSLQHFLEFLLYTRGHVVSESVAVVLFILYIPQHVTRSHAVCNVVNEAVISDS